ncbi:hypothetical protein LCGC14_0807800 [marine sediment metagenome]|uniref:DOD-type homing endonuclease domain-containing protein n=1 Tax=marine sediment metagenome TaxID=412755 RepID=A0A0F9Q7R0_9ZZZZ
MKSTLLNKNLTHIQYLIATMSYSTLRFIEDLRIEVSKLVSSCELHGGTLSYDKFSEYLGMHVRYIRDTRFKIKNSNSPKYNPEFKFSEDQLKNFLISLSRKLSDIDISRCKEIVFEYIEKNKLLKYRRQQWHFHNPNLKYEFFKSLDTTNKGYYFGLLLADGFISSDGHIGLFLEKKELKLVRRFRNDLHITNKLECIIDRRKKKQSGEYPERYGIRIGCVPMIEDLKELGFLDFKNGKGLKEEFFRNLRQKIALSVLLGFYDGDGEEGAPIIHNSNKQFLEQIRREFNVRHEVKIKKRAGREEVWIKDCDTKDQWYLRIGPDLFNLIMESCEFSMERKRAFYPMRRGRYAYEILRDKIGNKDIINELTYFGPRTKLAEFFGVSFDLFKRLCDELNVKTLPPSYWKRAENINWDLSFDKKIIEFKRKYLGNRS